MPLLRTTYASYLPEYEKAQKRIRRDREICAYIQEMINSKKLNPNNRGNLTNF